MKVWRFIVKNWFWISLGCVLQRKAIEFAYLDRGCNEVGGEWLVLPVVLMAVTIVRGIFQSIADVTKAEEV